MSKLKLPELQKLVDDTLDGTRPRLFAPGLASVIASIFLLLTSTVLLTGSLISVFGAELQPSSRTIFQFLGLFLFFFCVILPAVAIFRGYRLAAKISFNYSIMITLLGISALIGNADSAFTVILIVGSVLSLIALCLIYSPSYKLCCEFYYLLNKERKTSN